MSSGKDYASLNQRHFDSHAASYDEKPWIMKLNQWLAGQIEQRKEWIGLPLQVDEVGEGSDIEAENSNKEFKVLDYAAGTGNVSQALAPHVSKILAIDISQSMVDLYNQKVYNQGIDPKEMRAIRGDLISEKSMLDTTPEDMDNWKNFDLIVVGLGFHHFDDVNRAARQLSDKLSEDGTLLIIDFKEHEAIHGGSTTITHTHHHNHHHCHHSEGHGQSYDHFEDNEGCESTQEDPAHTVAHHGFTEESITSVFKQAGLKGIEVIDLAAGFSWVKNSNAMDAGEFRVDYAKEEEAAENEKKGEHRIKRMVFMAKGSKGDLDASEA